MKGNINSIWGKPHWIETKNGVIACTVHTPIVPTSKAVLLCPPLGYELWTSYKAYKYLAIAFSNEGYNVIRFDYPGKGNSSGTYQDLDLFNQWILSFQDVCSHFKNNGIVDFLFCGLRFGASLALLASNSCNIKNIILWDPIISGRRYVRELKMLAASSGQTYSENDELQVLGSVYSPETITSISKFDILKVEIDHLKNMVILDREDLPASESFISKLSATNLSVDYLLVTGTELFLNHPTEYGSIPKKLLGEIVSRAKCIFPIVESGFFKDFKSQNEVIIPWKNNKVIETYLSIGDVGLHAVLGTPSEIFEKKKIVIFLNSGTEHGIGPGRLWVDFSRNLNNEGISTLRIDFNGIGESHLRGPEREIYPYDIEQKNDLIDFVKHCKSNGYKDVYFLGLCASAWIAFYTAIESKVNGLILINPQLYYNLGEVYALKASEFRKDSNIEKIEAFWNRVGLWTLLDLVGYRPKAAHCLNKITDQKIKCLLLFSENDPGLIYIKTRIGFRINRLLFKKKIVLNIIKDIDHPMHKHKKRPDVYLAISNFLKR